MGLDIYTGTLVRYYSGNWKTIVQKWAEENNVPFQINRPLDLDNNQGQEKAITDIDEVQKAISDWKNYLNSSLSEYLSENLDWDENNFKDYESDKPDWDCYGALILWAIYNENKQAFPEIIDDWVKDKLFVKFVNDGMISDFEQLTSDTQFWLPCDFNFIFKAMSPNAENITIGSSYELLRQLNRLNEMTWSANEAQIIEWRKTIDPNVTKLEEKAKFGFSIMYQLTNYSVKNRTPMKQDY